MKYSLDGGQTYQDAPQGVRVIYDIPEIPGEDDAGELHVNLTKEGIILDIWMNDEENSNIGTSSEMVGDIVQRLIDED